ncbi:DoxX family protein [Rothia aerolata]|uniref:DoxX family membrane protein n=1 Tax=Rothia aerolata TaxID=1812262 RepID=A0A917MUE5_9MICC|nr:hypothetical protein [Rothia aerolata]GGH64442.1 hypothetical protein GCM10007359_16740 [Rothia aerolata]
MSIFSRDKTETRGQKLTRLTMGAALTGMGILHFKPSSVPSFESIVPPWVPGTARQVVYVSGLAELVLGATLLGAPRARRLAGLGAAALFAAVFPANVYQYTHRIDIPGLIDSDAKRLRRLPMQIPMIAGALYIARKK